MLSFATSVLHEYALIWSGDPALKQPAIPPECEPFADEPSEAFEARKAARDKVAADLRDGFERAYRTAIETGNWTDLKRPDAQPTVFRCRPIPGPLWRLFLDHVGEGEGVGGYSRPALAFRLAVVSVDNFLPGFKVERHEHVDRFGSRTGLGPVLSDDVIKVLDDLDPMIVTVLGYAIVKNRRGPSPL